MSSIQDILPKLAGRLFDNIISTIPGNSVFLSFDDGPDPKYTPQILDILGKQEAKATFFLSGSRVLSNQQLCGEIAKAGHTIASHGYSHRPLTFKNCEYIAKDLEMAQNTIMNACHVEPKYFRPPYGRFNSGVLSSCQDLKLKLVLWSLSSGDYRNLTPEALRKRILSRVNGGDIILLHDRGIGVKNMLKSLPGIISAVRDNGFVIKGLE